MVVIKPKLHLLLRMLKIIKKGVDKDQSYWVSVVDPNNNSDKQEFRMNIDNMNTWNLLETEKNIFQTMSTLINKKALN